MKFCNRCKRVVSEDCKFCPNCGAMINKSSCDNKGDAKKASGLDINKENKPIKNYTGAKVFMVLSCVLTIFYYCIPLIWVLPMTIVAFVKIRKRKKMSGFFKFATFILISPIVGIMLSRYNPDN